MDNYVHGYLKRESERLHDQADTLDELLHHDSIFPVKSKVLEAGCEWEHKPKSSLCKGTLHHVPVKRLNE